MHRYFLYLTESLYRDTLPSVKNVPRFFDSTTTLGDGP